MAIKQLAFSLNEACHSHMLLVEIYSKKTKFRIEDYRNDNCCFAIRIVTRLITLSAGIIIELRFEDEQDYLLHLRIIIVKSSHFV